jgi:hypothetical protein
MGRGNGEHGNARGGGMLFGSRRQRAVPGRQTRRHAVSIKPLNSRSSPRQISAAMLHGGPAVRKSAFEVVQWKLQEADSPDTDLPATLGLPFIEEVLHWLQEDPDDHALFVSEMIGVMDWPHGDTEMHMFIRSVVRHLYVSVCREAVARQEEFSKYYSLRDPGSMTQLTQNVISCSRQHEIDRWLKGCDLTRLKKITPDSFMELVKADMIDEVSDFAGRRTFTCQDPSVELMLDRKPTRRENRLIDSVDCKVLIEVCKHYFEIRGAGSRPPKIYKKVTEKFEAVLREHLEAQGV